MKISGGLRFKALDGLRRILIPNASILLVSVAESS